MFKEFVDEHNDKAVRKASRFIETKKVKVKGFDSFADNLAKTHLIVEFEEVNEEAPATKKPAAKKTTTKASTTTK